MFVRKLNFTTTTPCRLLYFIYRKPRTRERGSFNFNLYGFGPKKKTTVSTLPTPSTILALLVSGSAMRHWAALVGDNDGGHSGREGGSRGEVTAGTRGREGGSRGEWRRALGARRRGRRRRLSGRSTPGWKWLQVRFDGQLGRPGTLDSLVTSSRAKFDQGGVRTGQRTGQRTG